MVHRKAAIAIVMLVSTLFLTACGGSESITQDATSSGKELFEQATIASAAGCKTCHSLESGKTIIGPSLAGIAKAAASRVPELSAEEYLRQSINDPDAYIVEGYPASVMPNVYQDRLTQEQIDKLVAYMLSLTGDSG